MKNEKAKNQTKAKNTKNAKPEKKLKITKKQVLISCIAAVLLIGIGIGTFFIVDYALVDTPYDDVSLPKHIKVAKYIGAELSASVINSEYEKAKQSLLEKFTEKNAVKSGKVTEGQNVTVTVVAYDYTGDKRGAKINALCFENKEIVSIKKYDLDNLPKDEEILFPELQNVIVGVDFNFNSEYVNNMAPDLIYTYPDDYNISDAKGKKVLHQIYINGVTESAIPEWNDALFANNTDAIDEFLGVKKGFTTVAAYEEYMREMLRLNILWNNINDASVVIKYPKSKIEKYEKEFDDYYNAVMEKNQWEFSKLLTQLGTDEAGYISTRTKYAEGNVKEEMILYEIVQAEKIRVSSKEYDEWLTRLAADAGVTVDELVENYGKALAKRTVVWEITKRYLLERSVEVA